ncbi:SHOCT domain-containing protein [Actinoplanes sp. OR16]|uniref:SHOCT domain-containing protein n=1 Tax=Actinoplanes sp. OR16 TaxID=946334 RepID=UPI000FD9B28E|nr:SHOCT domain-containing protein [Actinoplanes sp. OR16]
MPGLLRGMARTAVIAGTATAVSNRVSRRQAGRWQRQADEEDMRQQYDDQQYQQQQPQQPQQVYVAAPVPAAPAADPMAAKIEQLQKLGELKTQGVLTDAEFEAQKARILNS